MTNEERKQENAIKEKFRKKLENILKTDDKQSVEKEEKILLDMIKENPQSPDSKGLAAVLNKNMQTNNIKKFSNKIPKLLIELAPYLHAANVMRAKTDTQNLSEKDIKLYAQACIFMGRYFDLEDNDNAIEIFESEEYKEVREICIAFWLINYKGFRTENGRTDNFFPQYIRRRLGYKETIKSAVFGKIENEEVFQAKEQEIIESIHNSFKLMLKLISKNEVKKLTILIRQIPAKIRIPEAALYDIDYVLECVKDNSQAYDFLSRKKAEYLVNEVQEDEEDEEVEESKELIYIMEKKFTVNNSVDEKEAGKDENGVYFETFYPQKFTIENLFEILKIDPYDNSGEKSIENLFKRIRILGQGNNTIIMRPEYVDLYDTSITSERFIKENLYTIKLNDGTVEEKRYTTEEVEIAIMYLEKYGKIICPKHLRNVLYVYRQNPNVILEAVKDVKKSPVNLVPTEEMTPGAVATNPTEIARKAYYDFTAHLSTLDRTQREIACTKGPEKKEQEMS